MHLTNESASAMGLDLETLPIQPWRRWKAAVPTEPAMARAAARLGAVYVLRSDGGDGVRMTALAGAEKFDSLLGCVYGPVLGDEHPALFGLLSAALEQVAVFELQRPDDRWSVDEVVDCIVAAEGMSV
jgi:hypothetical protein